MVTQVTQRKLLGQAIKGQRLKAGFTQEQLAEKCNLHWTFLSRVERGLADISVGNLLRIATATGVRVRDLVKEL